MFDNPYRNAVVASAYIFLLVAGIVSVGEYAGDKPDDEFLAPVVMLSLLTLSAAVMAFLFFYRPAILLLDGKRREAIEFFGRTAGTFAAITVAVAVIMLAVL